MKKKKLNNKQKRTGFLLSQSQQEKIGDFLLFSFDFHHFPLIVVEILCPFAQFFHLMPQSVGERRRRERERGRGRG